jgi:hypothetical protein
MPIGAPGVVALGHRGIPAGWQQPGAYVLVAIQRLFGNCPDLRALRDVWFVKDLHRTPCVVVVR